MGETPEKKPWTPADPLEDAEMEQEANDRAKLRARVKYLEEQASKPAKKAGKKNLFDV